MKRFAVMYVLVTMLFISVPAQGMFSGDTKMACEAVLCLSSGQRPQECTSAIKRYFSISMKKFKDTLKARRNFLKLCPSAESDPKMSVLVEAITSGAGRCDYAALNSQLLVMVPGDKECRYIKDELPAYCSAYNGNPYTDIKPPRYVGLSGYGGFWVEADKYEAGLVEYNARIKAQSNYQTNCN